MKKVAVVRERFPGECRVALLPENVEKLNAAGYEVLVEQGAGEAAGLSDQLYQDSGAKLTDRRGLADQPDLVFGADRLGLEVDYRPLWRRRALSKYEAVFPRVDSRRGRDIGDLGRHLPADNRKGALVNQYVMQLPRSQQPQYLKPESFYCSRTNLRVSDQSPTCTL